MSSLDISGIDKVALLKAMWLKQRPAGFFGRGPTPSFDETAATAAVTRYIDYFAGRAIKTDLSKDTISPYLYDRDAGGPGTLQVIVESFRI